METSGVGKWLAFVVSCLIIAGLSVILFYQSVATTVNKTSRCKRLAQLYSTNSVYRATARSSSGYALYEVNYNLGMKTSGYQCKCPPGDVLNVFKFPHRDLIMNTTKTVELNCSCDDNYVAKLNAESNGKPGYDGYPDLVDFMVNDRQDSFFMKPANFQF